MAESELLTRAQCQEIFERAERAARAGGAEVEVLLGVNSFALTRFANNSIHQNVAEERRLASIRTVLGQRTARATTNRFDEGSLRATVARALEITRAQSQDP